MTEWTPPRRCTRKGQCGRAAQPNQWLWSYEEDGHCLHVQSLLPAHYPRQKQGQVRLLPLPTPRPPPALFSHCFCCHPLCSGSISLGKLAPQEAPACSDFLECAQVTMSVPRLPTLAADEYFHCAFGDYNSLAYVEGPNVTCVTPPQEELPPNPSGTGEGPLGRVAGPGARGTGAT